MTVVCVPGDNLAKTELREMVFISSLASIVPGRDPIVFSSLKS